MVLVEAEDEVDDKILVVEMVKEAFVVEIVDEGFVAEKVEDVFVVGIVDEGFVFGIVDEGFVVGMGEVDVIIPDAVIAVFAEYLFFSIKKLVINLIVFEKK